MAIFVICVKETCQADHSLLLGSTLSTYWLRMRFLGQYEVSDMGPGILGSAARGIGIWARKSVVFKGRCSSSELKLVIIFASLLKRVRHKCGILSNYSSHFESHTAFQPITERVSTNLYWWQTLDAETILTLKVLVTTIDAQWEGMGDVGLAKYEPALLPPCPAIRFLSYSN